MAIPPEAYGDEPPSEPGYKSTGDLRKLSDADLADYIEQCTFDYDGTSQSVRVALARILRRPHEGQPK